MANFDAVIGADQTAANKTLASIFQNLPGLFAQQIDVNKGGLNTLEVSINETPAFLFEPSGITLTCPNVIIFDLSTGQGGVAVIVCNGSFAVVSNTAGGGGSFMTFVIKQATISVQDNPSLTALYNEMLAPDWIGLYNEYVLPTVRIPASYSIGGVTLSAPTVSIETSGGGDDFLTAYTALGPAAPEASAVILAPGVTSIGLDAPLINAILLAIGYQQNIGDSGGIPTPNFSWDYHVTVTPQDVVLLSEAIQVSLGISGGANFTFHTPGALPNVSFSGGLSGSCTAKAVVETMPNGSGLSILLRLVSVGGYSIQTSIDHLPGFLNDLISDVFGPIASQVGNSIGNNLDASWHTLFTIPPAPINSASVDGGTNLVLQNPAITINPELLTLQADMIAVPRTQSIAQTD